MEVKRHSYKELKAELSVLGQRLIELRASKRSNLDDEGVTKDELIESLQTILDAALKFKRQILRADDMQGTPAIVFVLRSIPKAGGSHETFTSVSHKTIDECMQSCNDATSGFASLHKPYEAAAWIENLQSPDEFEHVLSKDVPSYYAFKEWLATHLSLVQYTPTLSYTDTKILRMMFHLQDMKWANTQPITLNLACDLPDSILPKLPQHVIIRKHPCPWTGRPIAPPAPAKFKKPATTRKRPWIPFNKKY